MVYNNILELIGNTPLIRIDEELTGLKNIEVYVKCEYMNPFGSIKDRTAYALFKSGEKEIREKNIPKVVESSSGNTAKALAVISSMNGLDFKSVTNRIKEPEIRNILKLLGTELEELPGISECPDPSDPNDPVQYIERMVEANKGEYFHTSQYTNLANPEYHYSHTGKEVYDDLGNVDYFIATLGTAGSSMGSMKYLAEKNPEMEKIGIIAAHADMIPGIRNLDEMTEVGIFSKDFYDKIVEVNSVDSVDEMLKLIRSAGILGGPTTGACFKGLKKSLKEDDEKLEKIKSEEGSNFKKRKAVFIACDRVEPYISYVEKRRPEIFDESSTKKTVKNMTEEEIEEYAKEVEPEEVEQLVEQGALFIDLRGNMAFRNIHIPGTINITDMFFEDIIENGSPFTKKDTVILICANGDKSKQYSAYLNRMGMDVSSVKGGLIEWKDSGQKLERNIRKLR